MHRWIASLSAVGLSVLAGAPIAQAELVDYEFEANVGFLISAGLPADYTGLQMGDRFTMSFTLDTAVTDAEWRTFWGVYPEAIKDVTLSVSRLGLTKSYGDATLETSDGWTVHQHDGLRFDLPLGGGTTVIFWLRSGSPDGVNGPTVLTNDDIPAVLDPSQWNYTRTIGMYHNAGGPGNYTIFSGSPTPTPEPASLALLGLGAVAIATRRR